MDKLKDSCNVSSSFRDPSGFVFHRAGQIHRQINTGYKKNYDRLMNSGLYEALAGAGLLIRHEEVETGSPAAGAAYKTIRPETIPFISYPYEWCFSQLKDAALTTLKVQKIALDFGMSLKDCSAYNIQFRKGRPVLIDTLSFEEYREGKPWAAYRQFCQHFLAPLALMSCKDSRLNQLSRIYIDGVPLNLASRLLPLRTRFIFPLLMHIHLHAKAQERFADKSTAAAKGRMTRLAFSGLVDSLESAVGGLKCADKVAGWGDYYDDTDYSAEGFQCKKQAVAGFLDKINPGVVWDLGANSGIFSRIAGDKGMLVVSFDADHAAVEKNYSRCVADGEENILPLLLDLTNPSPGIGWENKERISLSGRGPADMVFALALIHHLAISNNLPFEKIAGFFGRICNSLVIEFVPKDDPQVQRLLSNREDIFPDYTQAVFEREFGRYFATLNSVKITDSQRVLYLMTKKDTPA